MSVENKRFLVSFSFAGEYRDFIEKTADLLSKIIGQDKVFYDAYYEAELAGVDLDLKLMDIYKNQSDIIMFFICKEYEQKDWCGVEWRQIREIIKEKKQDIDLMPFRFDDTELPGFLSIDGFVNVQNKTPQDIYDLILKRLILNQKISSTYPGENKDSKIFHSNLPYTRNTYFTGRENELKAIHKGLLSGECIALTQVIAGLGGVGKTQTALEYAYKYGHEYNVIWWNKAEFPVELLNDYQAFAVEKGLVHENIKDEAAVLKIVKHWMTDNTGWLFVLDNVENYEDIKRFLPVSPKGHILITSREKNWNRITVIDINVMTEENAVEFLIKRTGEDDTQAAAELAKVLGYLPLAMEQAAAYIIRSCKTYEEYRELFEKHSMKLFNNKCKPDDYHSTAAVTWLISIEKINKPAAKQLLFLCALPAPDNIPLKIFTQNHEHLPEPLKTSIQDELEYDEIIEDITHYCLAKVEKGCLSMHRLVQEAVICMEGYDKIANTGCMVNILRDTFRFDYHKQETWQETRELYMHAISIINHAVKLEAQEKKTAWLCNEAARYLQDIPAEYKEAESLYIKAMEIYKKVLRENHPETATSYYNLAGLYYSQGKYDEAEHFYKKSMEIDKKVYGEEHPDTASSYSSLALIYYSQGKYDKAGPLYIKAMEIRKKILGEEHPDTALSYNNLAGLYRAQGKYDEAEPLYKKAMKIRVKILGEEHPDTASSYNNLAELYRVQGKYDEAKPLYIKAMEIRVKILGEEHPDTATSYNNLAGLYYSQGKYDEAKPLYIKAMEIRGKILGEEHPDTASSYNNLAELYRVQGKYDEAKPLYIKAMEIRVKILGEEHPDTATSYNNLAALYYSQGKYEKAEPLYKKALEIVIKICGKNHLYTATSYNNLAALYYSQGKYDETEPLCKKALEIVIKICGKNHPYTATSYNNLAGLYYSQGKYEKAEPLYKKSMEIRVKILGEEHPDTASSYNSLAGLYRVQGKYDEAEPLYKKALDILVRVLGAEHPTTRTVEGNLALFYEDSKGNWFKRFIKRCISIFKRDN